VRTNLRAASAVDSARVVVVTGSSAGFLLVFTAAFDPGDVVAIPTTCYPCYRNILGALGVGTANLPLNKEFKITAKELIEEVQRRRDAGMDRIKGLILSSPGNPTGACLNKEEIYELCEVCEREGIR
jgi:aspartate/methionine/tyrosine aminotransferase